jgi:zinc protease
LRYGNEKSLFGLATVAEYMPSLMMKGTKQLTRQQIQDQLDQNKASMGASGGAGEVSFVIQTKRDKLTAVLDLLRQVLREPIFPASELEILKQGHRADLEQALTDPQHLALRAVRRKLNPYPVGDTRYYPTIEEEINLTDSLDATAITELYTDFVGAQDGQIVVVGDFDEERTVAAFSGMLKGWKSKQPYERISRRGDFDVKADAIKINTPDKANAFYFSGSILPLKDDNPDYPALVIGNYIFGAGALSSRLGDRIRQKEGLAYGVGSSLAASSLDKRASLTIFASYNPDNLDKITVAVREELQKLLESGVTQKELDDARRGYLQRQEVARTEDGHLSQILESTLLANRTMEFYAKQEQAIQNLTPDAIRTALRKWIDSSKILSVAAGDWAAAAKNAEASAEKK